MNTSLQAQKGLHTDTAGKTLPNGWERYETNYGVAYYIDHFTETTSWESPVQAPNPNHGVPINQNGDQEDAVPLLGSRQRESAQSVNNEKGSEVMRERERTQRRERSSADEKAGFMDRIRRQKGRKESKTFASDEKSRKSDRRSAGRKEELVYEEGVGWFPKQQQGYLVSHC